MYAASSCGSNCCRTATNYDATWPELLAEAAARLHAVYNEEELNYEIHCKTTRRVPDIPVL